MSKLKASNDILHLFFEAYIQKYLSPFREIKKIFISAIDFVVRFMKKITFLSFFFLYFFAERIQN